MIVAIITVTEATAVISVAAVLTLIAFLATRELASVTNSGSFLRIARFASIGILPLIIAFGVIVIAKIIEIL